MRRSNLARAATGRSKVLVFVGAYHGGVLSFLTGTSPINVAGPFVYASYNDIAGTTALIEEHADDLAAILLEPMLGAGGCIPGDPYRLPIHAAGSVRSRKTPTTGMCAETPP